MGCDARIAADEPTDIRFSCYVCGKPVDPEQRQSLKGHEQCSQTWNGREVLKVNIEVSQGFFVSC